MDLTKRTLKITDRFPWGLDQVLCLAIVTKERKDDKYVPIFFVTSGNYWEFIRN